jgi:DNA polymerase III epsilon subunit-like protein
MYLFFDTETTGLPKNKSAPPSAGDNWPRIVQLGWALFDANGRRIDGDSRLIKPVGFAIPADATRVHGITTAQALSQGVPLDEVLRPFAAAAPRSDAIVAHNIAFDEPILVSEFMRTNLKLPLSHQRRFCTMKMSTDYCGIPGPYGNKWPSLSELHQRLFSKPHTEAHDAKGDIEACARCFFELVRLNVIRA